jgi:DNA-binding IscR family transcriptional regulator
MYHVGRAHLGGERQWTVERLAAELGVPGIAIAPLVTRFEAAKLLVATDDDGLVPARDIGQIRVAEILDVIRDDGEGYLAPRNITVPSVDRLVAAIEEARRKACGNLTLRELVQEAPRPSLTLAARRD